MMRLHLKHQDSGSSCNEEEVIAKTSVKQRQKQYDVFYNAYVISWYTMTTTVVVYKKKKEE
ncbi:MAG: hypothetical protein ACLTUW_09210 [Lachnospira eligens]